jgi:hypothetical protein
MMPATPAWAFVGIKCTSLGFVSAPPLGGPYPLDGAVAALGGCDGNTGGKGVFTFSTTGPQIITWANGQTTELSRDHVSATENDPDTRGTCSYPGSEGRFTGVVKADTTGSAPVPGKYHYELCGEAGFPGLPPVLEPGSKVKIG